MATATTQTALEVPAETTVSRLLARETIEWQFEQLPPEVVHEAKRRVIDMLACVLGGYDSPPSVAIQKCWFASFVEYNLVWNKRGINQ